jgi:hypothetical protein
LSIVSFFVDRKGVTVAEMLIASFVRNCAPTVSVFTCRSPTIGFVPTRESLGVGGGGGGAVAVIVVVAVLFAVLLSPGVVVSDTVASNVPA